MVTNEGSLCVADEVGAGSFKHTGMFLGGDFHGLGAVVASDGSICAAAEVGTEAFTHTEMFLGGEFQWVGAVVVSAFLTRRVCRASRTLGRSWVRTSTR